MEWAAYRAVRVEPGSSRTSKANPRAAIKSCTRLALFGSLIVMNVIAGYNVKLSCGR